MKIWVGQSAWNTWKIHKRFLILSAQASQFFTEGHYFFKSHVERFCVLPYFCFTQIYPAQLKIGNWKCLPFVCASNILISVILNISGEYTHKYLHSNSRHVKATSRKKRQKLYNFTNLNDLYSFYLFQKAIWTITGHLAQVKLS